MTREMGDIAAALAYQVKKEIAENFFGTRKQLEEERGELLREEEELLREWAEKVIPIFLKIRLFLVGEEEGQAFLSLIGEPGIDEKGKREDSSLPSAEVNPLPAPSFGWTRKGKYRKHIFTLYRTAWAEAQILEERFRALVQKVALFNEDLTHFNDAFSLSEILSLTGALEEGNEAKCVLGESCEPAAVPQLEEKLRIRPLSLSRSSLPTLPPLSEIRKPLKELIHRSFRKYGPDIKRHWPAPPPGGKERISASNKGQNPGR